jgi:hypothetical protein
MLEIAGSLYLLATAAFSVMAITVGTRLVLLARRTGEAPERVLGSGLLLTGGLGYGLMIFGLIAGRQAAGDEEQAAVFTTLVCLGWILHNVGVVQMLRFVLLVFRPESRPARIAAVAMSAVLWIGWSLYVIQGGMTTGTPTSGFWIAFTVIGTYPFWMATESLRYHWRMRRQRRIGLGDPVVCDRFRLWTIASIAAAAAIWTVNVPAFLGVSPGSPGSEGIQAASMLATAVFGIATITSYWLAFFPPAWYRKRLLRESGPVLDAER